MNKFLILSRGSSFVFVQSLKHTNMDGCRIDLNFRDSGFLSCFLFIHGRDELGSHYYALHRNGMRPVELMKANVMP